MEKTRLKRRSILKTGAVIAPLAVSLHSGAAMAQVLSAACDVKMQGRSIIPTYTTQPQSGGGYINSPTGNTIGYQGTAGKTGRKFDSPVLGHEETHWEYISDPAHTGHSCYTSIMDTGGGTPNL